MKKILAGALMAASMTAAASAQVDQDIVNRIAKANGVIHALQATPDNGIPLGIAAHATCVVVVPSFKKAAFVVGGSYGQGLATCRTGHGWSAPVFVQLEGASFGFQIGGQATDLVLVGTNQNSLQDLLKEHVKLGAGASVAAGPVGRAGQAAISAAANAEFLAYSRNKGLFAGLDVSGDEIHQNSKDTQNVYGKDMSPEKILSGSVPTPAVAKSFVASVSRLFREARQ